ncbi:MAG: 1,4-alpha-glucan branching protein GlgB [Oscillospiraceae bacterium]|nr:1,4-alpha-glucan branching protein GlgB [Oscillospiraceae bacterium]
MDLHSFYMGDIFDAYDFFGAHTDFNGTVFRTYAPSAYRVTIMGDWTGWQEEEMQRSGQLYTYYSATAQVGHMYKYVIYSSAGRCEHTDPYAFAMELRPACASIVTDLLAYRFTDHKWMRERSKNYNTPMIIYELHLGSWKCGSDRVNGWYTYTDIADELIDYVKSHGYTHIEFMPLAEHPADESWGYQNTGFFAPTARYGTPLQLMELVDRCHNAGIGCIMDFVPVHFARDSYALEKYDGSALYEYPSSDVGESEWGTYNFMHSRREVCCFIQSAADMWLSVYHFDGLRMDAISRAIYWQGDPARGVNSSTIEFLKKMNEGLHKRHPTAMLIAEDSTDFRKVTAPAEYGGLGFDYKWDLGWMHDTLDLMALPPEERGKNRTKITFSMHYFSNELYLLPISHDENVHGKKTVIDKMWGDYDDKFAQVKILYMYMYTHPGKKLLFMGSEFGQFREWDVHREQDWELLGYDTHRELSEYMEKLCGLYLERKSLYCEEYDPHRFEWIDVETPSDAVFAYRRTSGDESTVVILNFSDEPQQVSFSSGKLTLLLAAGDFADTKDGVMPPFSAAMYDETG